ncbi:MAG: gephyrin-like molybdotransferase Glp [Methylocystaceae bacterium]
MHTDISLEEAQNLLLEAVSPVSPTMVPLWYAAQRILSEDIAARYCIPPNNRSAMDGYAIIADDTKAANSDYPIILKAVEAGNNPVKRAVYRGACCRVMTGDQMPAGSDAVIKLENAAGKNGMIQISCPVGAGENVVVCGEDFMKGDLVAGRGSIITPGIAAALAGQGWGEVPIFRTVKIGILSTGDELLYPTQRLETGKIYNMTLYGLNARCRNLGAEVIDLGPVPDYPAAIAARIDEGLARTDLVVITGGVSVGESDLVETSLRQLGADLLFHGVAMKPGSPALAASTNNKVVVGLSGNPAAALVGFELLVIPLISRLQGRGTVLPPRIKAVMADRFDKPSPQRRFLRGQLLPPADVNMVRLTGTQGNSVVKSMIGCNVLVDVPAGSGPITYGQMVEGFLIGGE